MDFRILLQVCPWGHDAHALHDAWAPGSCCTCAPGDVTRMGCMALGPQGLVAHVLLGPVLQPFTPRCRLLPCFKKLAGRCAAQ
eukprot:1157376-Pelagomonas_calceolata.AAC.6